MKTLRELAERLQFPIKKLSWILGNTERYYQEFYLTDPRKLKKPRLVANPIEPLREVQNRLYRRIFLQEFEPSEFSHGGVPGRSLLTNLRPHLDQQFIFTADISNFYPSIRPARVARLFRAHGWSNQVAVSLTRLCTFQHHLAQGLITSPFLADQILKTVDCRIADACNGIGLIYTRFVDDISVSGPFDLEDSGVPAVVEDIIRRHGFKLNKSKSKFGSSSDKASITKLRFHRGHPDVSAEYISELERQLEDAHRVARGWVPEGPYYTQAQIFGRVQYVCWVNPFRKSTLLRKHKAVDWKRFEEQAMKLGLQECKGRLVRAKDLV